MDNIFRERTRRLLSELSEELTLKLLVACGERPATEAELVDRTKASRASVRAKLDVLEARELLRREEVEPEPGGTPGRRPMRWARRRPELLQAFADAADDFVAELLERALEEQRDADD